MPVQQSRQIAAHNSPLACKPPMRPPAGEAHLAVPPQAPKRHQNNPTSQTGSDADSRSHIETAPTVTYTTSLCGLIIWRPFRTGSPGCCGHAGSESSWDRLAAPAGAGGGAVEAAGPDKGRAATPGRRHLRRARVPPPGRLHRADRGPGPLPGSRPLGRGGAGPLGPVGRALPDRGGRPQRQKARPAGQGPHGPAHPATPAGPADGRPRRQRTAGRCAGPSAGCPGRSGRRPVEVLGETFTRAKRPGSTWVYDDCARRRDLASASAGPPGDGPRSNSCSTPEPGSRRCWRPVITA